MSRIMQKEIKSEMNDFFFAKDHLDFYHEYVNVEQKYLAGIKEVRTKLEILDDEFNNRFDHNHIHHNAEQNDRRAGFDRRKGIGAKHGRTEKARGRGLPFAAKSRKGISERRKGGARLRPGYTQK